MPPLLFSVPYDGRHWVLEALPGNGRLFRIVGQWDNDKHVFYPMDDLPLATIHRLNAYLTHKAKGK